jgi:hypothetical protein
MLPCGEAPERPAHHVRFHPDKESVGAIVVSSHLLDPAITLPAKSPCDGVGLLTMPRRSAPRVCARWAIQDSKVDARGYAESRQPLATSHGWLDLSRGDLAGDDDGVFAHAVQKR